MAQKSEDREQQLADPKLLDKIDQLFALNIGDHVALPQVRNACPSLDCTSFKLLRTLQLVVVGDQSRYISSSQPHSDSADTSKWKEFRS